MKNSTRIFVLSLLALITSGLTAISRQRAALPADNSASVPFRHGSVLPRTQAVPFYSQDFSSGIPGTWQVNDNSSNGLNWTWTNTGAYSSSPGLDSLSTVGTSAANGYMIFDSDSAGGVGGEDADLISETIDCSANVAGHLTFNQLLVHFAEAARVSVSNDGGTVWNDVYDASAGLAQYQATPNPDFVDVDITAFAAGQATVQIKFNFQGNYDFWWMIDDVQLYEPSSVDGGVSGINGPLASCALLSATETISVEINNYGGVEITNFDVSYVVDNGTAVTEIVTDTIAAGSSLSYSFTTAADLSAAGMHTIVSYTAIVGDTITSNDTASTSIFTGPTVANASTSYSMGFEDNEDLSTWAVDDVNLDGYFWNLVTTNPHSGTTCARMSTPNSTVPADDWLFTTCLELNDTTNYDLSYFYRTSSTSTQAFLEVMVGTDQTPAGMTQSLISFHLINNVSYLTNIASFTVPANGIYYIGFHVANSDSATNLRIDDINLSGSSGVGINEVSKNDVSVYPNPAAGYFHLNSAIKSNSFQISVCNTIGQVVFESNYSNLSGQVLDLTNQPVGQYFVRVISDAGVSTQSISVVR
ncbi:MAG: T9SS type A sorting domain-containing protein [Bacteroidetes bacterium]|nr:T9SS type A sorting domain-containing protein [Bacteroidota bacterium]